MLYRWNGPELSFPQHEHPLQWEGKLSSAQKRASDAVAKTVQEQKQLLLWAVCGAGKTEVLFEGIARALSAGKRVLVATPRTDVVKELFPRFKKSFPRVTITALYGGNRHRRFDAQFVVATTHQVMRYYKAFDWIVVDEVDAFPFSFDKSLRYAINEAKKETSSLIYLSATPSKEWLRSPDIEQMKIPKRYHGYPLPIPKFKWCGNWLKSVKKGHLPKPIRNWLTAKLKQQKQVLLFVPSIHILRTLSEVLQSNSFQHDTVHAADNRRHALITDFREQKSSLLVTTTILERGVTFPDVQVGVVGAEQDIFTEAALVQIAGRVGRHRDWPDGDVIFFHYGVSLEMRRAYTHINLMNREGGF